MNVFHESSRTSAEKKLAAALQRKHISFRQNQTIYGYEIDFWLPEYRLIIEVDGYTHLSHQKLCADKHKDQILIGKGLVVLRLKNHQIRENLAECLLEIEATMNNLKALKMDLNINHQWKDSLKKCNPAPSRQVKKVKSIEEYFLSMDGENK